MTIRMSIAAGLLGLASPALAESTMILDSAVFLETSDSTGAGSLLSQASASSAIRRGDKVVLMVQWDKRTNSRSFAVMTPIPRTLAFQRSSHDSEEVSVDGGKSWGTLGELLMPGGKRRATPEDVTHVRWRISDRYAAGSRGRIAYSAIVR